jgi:DNA replication protein DnaC
VSARSKIVRLASADATAEPCPLGACDGSGWILGPEDVARPCACRERRSARRRARGIASAIPRKYRGVSLDRPPVSDMAGDPARAPVYRAVKEYLERIGEHLDRGRGLWLMGDVGTGKTTLAMLISKAAVEAGRAVAIYSLPRLLARIRRTYDAEAGEQSYLEFFERLTAVDLLHLDDLGAERRTDWVIEQLYSIVDERYESERSMVVTLNIEPRDMELATERRLDVITACVDRLKEQIGPRTVSRLVEICGDPLPLFGDDLRYRVA